MQRGELLSLNVNFNHTAETNCVNYKAKRNKIKNIVPAALDGLAAVVNRVTCFAHVPGSILYVHACHPRGVLPAPGLA